MRLSPRYDGPPVFEMGVPVGDPGRAVTSQRRRMERMLADLSPAGWATPSRCEGWSVRDVTAHLVTVNEFWESSVRAGRDGAPSRLLASFDPAAHPEVFVASLAALDASEVLERFVSSNDGFPGLLAELTDQEWSLVAESPVGHVGLEWVVDHALWDAWVHERDVMVPLGLPAAHDVNEVAATLRYAAAVGPALTAGRVGAPTGTFAVVATEPETAFVVEVNGTVAIHGVAPAEDGPCLRGPAVELIDALSLRAPLPPDTPDAWRALVQGLVNAFAKG